MKIIETVVELQNYIQLEKRNGKTVGFVPTMGALHDGHIALVKRCQEENGVCVVSIFVNPTQFNNAGDLKHYPRTMEADCARLESVHADIVFAPTVDEVYPEEDTRQFEFGALDKVMEGEHRPGHFNGVAQVVSKLFDMVKPHRAYFGEKDFQQLAIIKAMVRDYNIPVEVVPCPIVREADGLAMSSRNRRLTPAQREASLLISKTLFASREWMKDMDVAALKSKVMACINASSELDVEYFDVADVLTLQPVKSWEQEGEKVGCIAVFAGEVRLIDNVLY